MESLLNYFSNIILFIKIMFLEDFFVLNGSNFLYFYVRPGKHAKFIRRPENL